MLVGCGQTTTDPPQATAGETTHDRPGTAGGAGAGGVSGASISGPGSASNEGASGPGSGGGSGSGSGGAGGAVVLEPPVDISGRWSLFYFDDPVGVQIVQDQTGLIRGRGCAAGTPGYQDDQTSLCNDLVGQVSGNTASFGFSVGSGGFYYSTQVVASADRLRLTGTFSNGARDMQWPVAWIHPPDDALGLTRIEPPRVGQPLGPLEGGYELALASAQGGSAYTTEGAYELTYFRYGMHGPFGSFWGSEMTAPVNGKIRVGPVPATSPDLATTLELSYLDDDLTEVVANVASGATYTFTAKRRLP